MHSQDQYTQLPWEQPDWLQQATAWIHEQLAASGRQGTGPVELLHQRSWSTFARMNTDKGTVHFKAPASVFKYEAAVTKALARWRPDYREACLRTTSEQINGVSRRA